MMTILCLGVTLANTATDPTRSCSCLSLSWSICLPVRQLDSPLFIFSPRSLAMLRAVCSASPVIITTWMPAPWRAAIASPTPRRGGSSMAWKPAKTSSDGDPAEAEPNP